MTVAELFVNIGIKGAEKASHAISSVQNELKETFSSGVAAKAAILGVVYALQQMTVGAGKRGAELANFSAATGISADTLQRWQYVLGRVNVGAEEVTGTIAGLQKVVTNIVKGGGVPQWFDTFSRAVKLDPTRMRDMGYMMQKLQEFARSKNFAPDVMRDAAESLGVGMNVLGGLKRNSMDISQVPKSAILSPNTIVALDHVNEAWFRFNNSIKLFGENIAAKYGITGINALAGALSGLQKAMNDISSLFTKLSKEAPAIGEAIKLVGLGILAYLNPITATVLGLIYLLSEYNKYKNNQPSLFNGKSDIYKSKIFQAPGKIMDYLSGGDFLGDMMDNEKLLAHFRSGTSPGAIGAGGGGVNTHVSIFTESKDPKRHGEITGKAVNDAVVGNKARTQSR